MSLVGVFWRRSSAQKTSSIVRHAGEVWVQYASVSRSSDRLLDEAPGAGSLACSDVPANMQTPFFSQSQADAVRMKISMKGDSERL